MLKKLKWSQFEYHWDLWHLERVSRVGSDSRESSGDSRAPVAALVTMNGDMVRPQGYISPCQPEQLLHPHVGSPAQATVGSDHHTGHWGKWDIGFDKYFANKNRYRARMNLFRGLHKLDWCPCLSPFHSLTILQQLPLSHQLWWSLIPDIWVKLKTH